MAAGIGIFLVDRDLVPVELSREGGVESA